MNLEKRRKTDLIEFYRNLLATDDEKLIIRLATHSRVVTVDKGDVIFSPEAIAPATVFLLDGVIKTYILSPDGSENTFAFYYKPGTPICMTKDMINDPGIWCKALTRTTLVELVGPGLYELVEDYPSLYQELFRGWWPFYFGMMDKLRAVTTLTAKERYLWFLDKYGPVVGRISQVEIAMYLGIKPQSLSRIRSEMAAEEKELLKKK